LLSLSVMDVNLQKVKNNLEEYAEKYYPGRDILESVRKALM
jgi:hypothetical protein